MEDFIERAFEKEYAEVFGRQGNLPITPIGGRSEGKSAYMEQFKKLMEYYQKEIVEPKYIMGIDLPTNIGKGSIGVYGNLPLPKGTRDKPLEVTFSFPTKELKEQLNKLKTKNMKTKRFYHTFEYENRKVTLCLLVEEQEKTTAEILYNAEPSATVRVGYAVCVPEDTFDQDLAKRISLGRAESEKARLNDLSMGISKEFAFDLGILNATARIFERRIKRGDVVIKGVQSAVEKRETTKSVDTPLFTNEEEE